MDKNKKSRKGRYSTSRSRRDRQRDMVRDAESTSYPRVIRGIKLRATQLKNKSPKKSREMMRDVHALERASRGKKSSKSRK